MKNVSISFKYNCAYSYMVLTISRRKDSPKVLTKNLEKLLGHIPTYILLTYIDIGYF